MYRMKKKTHTEKLTSASLLLAVGIILPFVASHGLGIPGTVLLPMHIPVFLAGLLLGPAFGAGIGLILPPLNTILTGMPAFFPMMPIMTAELFTYGAVSGILFYKTPLGRKRYGIYISMIAAMAAGRISYGITFELLMLAGEHKALSVSAALITGIPGIIIQLLFIPAVTFTVGNIKMKQKENIIASAKNLIFESKASAVVINNGRIVSTECAQGISPIVSLYERGLLNEAVIVDKIVGKAAAQIMVLGGAKSCYGITMSSSALEYLRKNGIYAEFEILTERINNRAGDGICPMEAAIEDIDDPACALAAIRERLAQLMTEKA